MSTKNVDQIRVSWHRPSHRYLSYYDGTVEDVVTTSLDGRKVRFPAGVLRPYLTRRGIVGTFIITVGTHHKFVSIDKAEPTSS